MGDPARLTEEQTPEFCPCGHILVMCHRVNAAKWCPPSEAEEALRAERATSERLREAIKCQHDWRTTERDGKTWWKCVSGCGLMELWEGGLIVDVALDA